MREITLKNNTSNRKIFVDDKKPDLSLIPQKDIDLYIALLELEMYEHFKKTQKTQSARSARRLKFYRQPVHV